MSNYFSFSLIFREITHNTLQGDLNTTVSNRKEKTLLEKVQQLTIFLSSVKFLLLCLSNLSSPLKVLFFQLNSFNSYHLAASVFFRDAKVL